jgi:hypothetical protein
MLHLALVRIGESPVINHTSGLIHKRISPYNPPTLSGRRFEPPFADEINRGIQTFRKR